jgi:uncharacterized short protein YbdD (DUF466 family)
MKKYKLTDLKGLGKHVWKGVDAQEYVNELRGKNPKKKKLTKSQYLKLAEMIRKA